MDIHPSAFKHGIAAGDIEHAVRNAIVVEELDDDLFLYIGAGSDGSLLEIVSLLRSEDRGELIIHGMAMRAKYERLLPGGS